MKRRFIDKILDRFRCMLDVHVIRDLYILKPLKKVGDNEWTYQPTLKISKCVRCGKEF